MLVAAIGAARVLLVRLGALSRCWRWSAFDQREPATVYALWRALHDLPLYVWPNRPPYSVALYNFGFYRAYAAFARLLGLDGEALLGAPRLFTLAGGLLGAALFVKVGSTLARPREPLGWAGLCGLGFTLFLGTQFATWWALGLRPDVWAAALALSGLALALSGLSTRRWQALVLASFVFFLAWTFEQACVWTFAGCVVACALLGEVRAGATLALPCFALAGLALVLGGPAYRFDVLHAPALSAWHTSAVAAALARSVPQNLWIFGCAGWFFLARGTRPRLEWSRLETPARVVAVVGIVAAGCGLTTMGREGEGAGHLFEAYVALGLAGWWALGALARTPNARSAGLLLMLGALVPFALMPFLEVEQPQARHRLELCSRDDAAQLARLASAVERLPKPLFSEAGVFALPWHATHAGDGALVLDAAWFAAARRAGIVAPDFPLSLLESGHFSGAVLPAQHPVLLELLRRGHACRPLDGKPFGVTYYACSLGPS